MESYRLLNNGYIQRQSDLALIPPIDNNPDYLKYLQDKEAGAEVLPFDYEAEAERLRLIEEVKRLTLYRDLRRPEYPPIGDQFDNIMKALKYLMEKGIDIGPDGKLEIDLCMAIKKKYPKP